MAISSVFWCSEVKCKDNLDWPDIVADRWEEKKKKPKSSPIPVGCFWHKNNSCYRISLWPKSEPVNFFLHARFRIYEIYVNGDKNLLFIWCSIGNLIGNAVSSACLLCRCVLADPTPPSHRSGFLGKGISQKNPTIELFWWRKLKLNFILYFSWFIRKRNENRGVWVWAQSAHVFMYN